MSSESVPNKKLEKRVHYYNGQTLRAEDLLHDQEYHIDRLRRHNRLLHPHGVLDGLTVALNEAEGQIIVTPGTAMDNDGRLIVLSEATVVTLNELPPLPAFLVITYDEIHSDQYDIDDNSSHIRIHENPALSLISENELQEKFDVILAKVSFTGEWLSVDSSYQTNTPMKVRGGLNVGSIQADQSTWKSTNKIQLNDANQLYFGQTLARNEHWFVVTDAGYLPGEAGTIFIYDVHNPQAPAQQLQAFQNTTFASDIETGARFGMSAALDGNWLIVGAPNKDDSTGEIKNDAGAAYVFQLIEGTWTPHTKIEAFEEVFIDGVLLEHQTATEASANFGLSLALKGNWITVAAPAKNFEGYQEEGAVYLYYFDGSQWQPSQILTTFTDDLAPHHKNNYRFGYSLAMDDYQIAVAAPKAGLGAVYLFHFVEGQWLPQVKLKPFNDDLSEKTGAIGEYHFGVSVAMHQNRLVVGAENPFGGGIAFVFNHTDNQWTAEKTLKPFKDHPDGTRVLDFTNGTRFGWSVSIDNGQVAVGAIYANNPSGARTGVAYLFECDTALDDYSKKVLYPWQIQPDGSHSISNHGGNFGARVLVLANDVFVSATYNRNNAAVYHFANTRASIHLHAPTGNIGIGTATPTEMLEIAGNLKTSGSLSIGNRLRVNTLDSGGAGAPVLWDSDSKLFYADTSSLRYKENIQSLDDNFLSLLTIDPKTYTRPGHPKQLEIGYLAEDLDAVGLKHLVRYDKDGKAEGVHYSKTTLYLAKILQQQQKTIMELQKDRQEDKQQIDDLARRITILEAKNS